MQPLRAVRFRDRKGHKAHRVNRGRQEYRAKSDHKDRPVSQDHKVSPELRGRRVHRDHKEPMGPPLNFKEALEVLVNYLFQAVHQETDSLLKIMVTYGFGMGQFGSMQEISKVHKDQPVRKAFKVCKVRKVKPDLRGKQVLKDHRVQWA